MSYEAPFAAYIGKSVKERYPDIPFLVGGIHPTICPEECLEYADMAASARGKRPCWSLRALSKQGAALRTSITWCLRMDAEIIKNPLRPLIDDLDRIPFPEHLPAHSHVFHGDKIHAMDMKLFRQYTRYDGKAYNMITSRGCPFSCAYCCNSFLSRLYGTKKIRKRSPGNVIAELCAVIKQFPDIILVNIHDDCFLAHSREWHEEFVRRL